MAEREQLPLLQWMGLMLARFVGLVFVLYGLLVFVGNLIELFTGGSSETVWWVWAWVLVSGLAALAGGVMFILTFDGPDDWRTRMRRAIAVGLMLIATLLPSQVASIVFVLGILSVPTIWLIPSAEGGRPPRSE